MVNDTASRRDSNWQRPWSLALAPAANKSVECVSWAQSSAGDTLAMMQLRELPPKLSCSEQEVSKRGDEFDAL